MEVIKPQRIILKTHPTLNEKWIQNIIADDPAILGLGDIVLKDRERVQPRAGRLDLLFQDSDSPRRYEVEIQLGKTDESHIVRTIEYWDIERKRYPQYDHCAVIVAEDITSRFLNVIGLFNGFIPLMAIQMKALKVGDKILLDFTTVLDQMTLGYEEDEGETEATDREYWIKKGSKETVAMADQVLEIIQSFEPDLKLKYNKFYIGLAKNGQPRNFAVVRAKKDFLRLEFKLPESDEIQQILDDAGLDVMEYDKRWGSYRIRISKKDLTENRDVLATLLKMASENYVH
jgi:hypothetical protein